MAASDIKRKYGSLITAPTWTLASLAATPKGRISDRFTIHASNLGPFMLEIWIKLVMGGTAPTAGNPLKVYGIGWSGDATDLSDDNLGATDADVTTEPANAECLHTFSALNATGTIYQKRCLWRDPPMEGSLLVWNGAAILAASGHVVQIRPVTFEGQ